MKIANMRNFGHQNPDDVYFICTWMSLHADLHGVEYNQVLVNLACKSFIYLVVSRCIKLQQVSFWHYSVFVEDLLMSGPLWPCALRKKSTRSYYARDIAHECVFTYYTRLHQVDRGYYDVIGFSFRLFYSNIFSSLDWESNLNSLSGCMWAGVSIYLNIPEEYWTCTFTPWSLWNGYQIYAAQIGHKDAINANSYLVNFAYKTWMTFVLVAFTSRSGFSAGAQ